MVRFAALAVFFLSASVAFGRPTHRRRAICRTSYSSARPTPTPTVASNFVIPGHNESSSSSRFSSTRKPKTTSVYVTKTKAKTSTSIKAGPTPTPSDDGDDGGSDSGSGSVSTDALFPVNRIDAGWSVAAGSSPANAKDLTLNSKTWIIEGEASGSSHPIINWQGRTSMLANIPEGMCDAVRSKPDCGFSFYTPGPRASGSTPVVDLTKGKEITFSYSIFFSEGFDFNLGGKLPGLYGGSNDQIAKTCSGGRHSPHCFSARLMFRPKGAGELYLYIPEGLGDNGNKCGKKANSKCESTYGESVGRGTWTWATGRWQTVSERILLNDIGEANGEAEIYIDGESVLKVTGISWRSEESSVVRGIQMQIFFGGHTKDWASPKNQKVYFSDFSAAITKAF
ncbi:hypothetical protein FRB99_004417 [Tulasnella sp. 403]|nr:hypothetical protein FRB99_004417 [Tulasnella sp. 403]